MMRTSTGTERGLPTGRTSPSCRARSSLTWKAGEVSPISSRNRVPPSACWNRPMRSSWAPVKAPFLWPKSSRFEQGVGHGAAVLDHEGSLGALAGVVNGARQQFLAGAGFAGDQHGQIVRGDALAPVRRRRSVDCPARASGDRSRNARLTLPRRLATAARKMFRAVAQFQRQALVFLLQAPQIRPRFSASAATDPGCQGFSRYCQMPASLMPAMMSSASV